MIGDRVAGFLEFVRVGAHRGEKEHDLLLMMADIGAKPQVFGHEDGRRICRRQMLRREELVTENDQHVRRQ